MIRLELPEKMQPKDSLSELGAKIRQRRKELKVSSNVMAEASGISRMTLYRIEKGESSVAMGHYMDVLSALGLDLRLIEMNQVGESTGLPTKAKPVRKSTLPGRILVKDYPQLKNLAWQLGSDQELTPKEALNLYERNWRHVDQKNLCEKEQDFIKSLLKFFGREKLLV